MGRVFITGDTHGSAAEIRNRILQIKDANKDDFVIICGDAGFEYQDHVMGSAKKEAEKFPGTWIVLRGNHDSSYWKEHTYIDKDDTYQTINNSWEIFNYRNCAYLRQKKYPNIWYLPDEGCIYNIEDYEILFIPGAYSVDKDYRIKNYLPWNPNEQLTKKEKKELYTIVSNWIKNNFSIDFIVGHTFPIETEKYYRDLFLSFIDQSEVDKTTEIFISEICSIILSFKQYFGGHIHDDRILTDKHTMLFHSVKNLADYTED